MNSSFIKLKDILHVLCSNKSSTIGVSNIDDSTVTKRRKGRKRKVDISKMELNSLPTSKLD